MIEIWVDRGVCIYAAVPTRGERYEQPVAHPIEEVLVPHVVLDIYGYDIEGAPRFRCNDAMHAVSDFEVLLAINASRLAL